MIAAYAWAGKPQAETMFVAPPDGWELSCAPMMTQY